MVPMADIRIRDYVSSDADDLNRIAVAAFDQFRDQYEDWPAMRAGLCKTSGLSATGEIIVVECRGQLAGGVAYFGPHRPKAPFFDSSWPVIRMLVVDPASRGNGLGRLLTMECIARARRDKASVIALHTSPIMTVALPMYLRMGFVRAADAPPIFGVEYSVYTKAL
jgi:GNAT superfamily N-acetyltransferase